MIEYYPAGQDRIDDVPDGWTSEAIDEIINEFGKSHSVEPVDDFELDMHEDITEAE